MTINTAKGLILMRLLQAWVPLAVHELKIKGYSENCLATRLPELAKDGLVESHYREGESYKEWQLTKEHGIEEARRLVYEAQAQSGQLAIVEAAA